VDRDDPCWLFFTSGSTGRPKAVVLTHGQLGFTTVNHLNDLMPGTTEADVSLVVAPLSHGAGMHQLTQIAAGAVSVLLPSGRFDPSDAWRLVAAHGVTNMFTVPTIVKMLTEHPSVLRKLGKVLVQYFGLGEVTGAITVLRPSDHHLSDGPETRVGTCGIERTGLHVSIQDANGAMMPPGGTGEICVAGGAVCAGYYRDDVANGKAFRDGWFLTGDLGHLDAQGYLFITGRASDMYISGGSNVYPREIEELILTLPGVSEVAILGMPDRKWGEVGLAVVVTAPGAVVEEADIAALVASKLAKYKLPARYVFLDEMPKTGYGKITKKLVREELQARGLWPEAIA
jgi:acyl-CoA synthetase (AMP-forming)/AMP-acid ligase II